MPGGLFELIEPLERIIRAEAAGEAAGPPVPTSPEPAATRATAGERLGTRWAAFAELSRLLTSSRIDFDAVLRAILDLVIRHTAAERGLLILCGSAGGFEVEIARNDREESIDPATVAYSRSVLKRSLQEKRPIVASGPGLRAMSDSVAALGLASAMCVPMLVTPGPAGTPVAVAAERRRRAAASEPEVVGALYVDSALSATGYHPEDLEFFVALANQATSTVLNARLYQEATTEPLSGLYTRWHLRRVLAEAARRAAARKAPYAALLVDVDGLKAVNDEHGRAAGDEAIREVGALLRSGTRAIDACFRYGGGEFAVVLADTDEAGALAAAEKLRAMVEARRLGAARLSLTVSIGVAAAPARAHDPAAVLARADQALFEAKAGGRNRVAAGSPETAAAGKRKDRLAGIVTGDFAADYNNVAALIDAVASIASAADLADLLTIAVDRVVEATGAERGALMLADGGKLATVVARDRRKRDLALKGERFSRSIPERVLATGESVWLADASEREGRAPEAGAGSESASDLGLRTIMCVPLATKDRRLGVIYVDSRARPGDLRESNLPFFEALARQVATAIENARLRARLLYQEGE